ncbi:hypothetical protein BL250_05410 [Erwinia sp. OLTSP20]|nr:MULTISPECIES: alpha/beta hydrolase [unclassified Erwinia]PIJ51443.1 hypothetical protein BV501_04245 [Erwinia sp. OAMSP11]PIJ73465.1 hypothetical protein BK416_07080 [Erwinia sp. OLSSP12]PIJ85528.1 hypothetical protein BLD47_00230 [Erwinia sp. OLCASP19]PIJ85926.1 hypothetical protein BLD46_05275 [Erwinia sp. OLMTSP26]PIJ87407.1 hypothetical protein BLD49_06300 [Erwinia sp. OLMDSP33]
MQRRQFIRATFASGLSLIFADGYAAIAPHQAAGIDIPLWPGLPPGGGGPVGAARYSSTGALSHIARPGLTLLPASGADGKAVLIAAGGGYKRISLAREAWPAACWLQQQGYNAYILCYRLPGEGWHDGASVALQDARRALRVIASREKRLSVLGFSAGGHLMGMAITANGLGDYPPQDALDDTSVSVDGAALIYPVVTLERPWSHTSTHRMLVGPQASDQQNARWSVQRHVTPATPPVFLVQAEDDTLASPHNSIVMAEACQRAQVPVELHLYRNGGHGFALGKAGTATVAWPAAYRLWLKRIMAE